MPPLISIGVPVYNGAGFLPQALDSLLGQTVADFELIISDNASTDDTEKVCRDYAKQDERIRYIRQPINLGAPANWNFVAVQARGKYFKWSSANDYCAPEMLARCVAPMEADPGIVLCYGRTCLVEEESGRREEYSGDFSVIEGRPHERFNTLCRMIRLNNAQSGLIRVDALRRTQLDRHYPGGDVVLMAELALQGRFLLLPEILLYRRMGREAFSSLLTPEEMGFFFDPQRRSKYDLRLLWLHLDFLVTVLRASLSLPEKLQTLALVARRAVWARSYLWAEFRAAILRKRDRRHA
ncbi:MAG TPA: glycosyltransferase family 2 protein [Terriglobales bacterium]|nr:glycosyltransferase family 2 protein [Terriglobales bacterium]